MNHMLHRNAIFLPYVLFFLSEDHMTFPITEECGSAPHRAELLSHKIRSIDRVYEADPLVGAVHS